MIVPIKQSLDQLCSLFLGMAQSIITIRFHKVYG